MSQEQLQVQLLVQSSEQSGRQVQIQLQEEQLINLIDDDFIKMFQENILPVRQLMSCYRCCRYGDRDQIQGPKRAVFLAA